jgi:AraC family transcriptional regulator of adaptative response/methylated-DNA-[protein]-cysteine methyltransferase
MHAGRAARSWRKNQVAAPERGLHCALMMTDLPLPADPDSLQTRAADYERVTAALDYLSEHWRDQPDLAAAAQAAGLSPHHFQRVFTRWTGASPKKLVQALTHASARKLLVDGASVLDAALETGLSGPSRLHDIFITEEAATPGDVKSGGSGLDFRYGFAPSPFGRAVFLIAPRGLSGLAFCNRGEEEDAFDDLARRFPMARYERNDAQAQDWAGRVFDAAAGETRLPLALYGAPFRRQVWRALLAIPPARTVSYGNIARATGRDKAARAAGAAVGANPISWLIPCHRVLAADGRLTGYHWGLDRKRAMLAYEAATG